MIKIIFSTLCIILLALFAYQVMSYPLADENNSKLSKDLARSIDYELPRLAVLNGINEYSEIIKRPLFVKDRAAAVSVRAVSKVTTVDELSHLVLVGTASSSDVQIAIIADTKAKQMERLKTGETYQQWNISEVASDHVVFQNAELEYKLFVTPIKGSQKDKQAKLLSQLKNSNISQSKIDKATAAIKSYKGWKGASKGSSRQIFKSTDNLNYEAPKKKVSGKTWNYGKKSNQNNTGKRSPIKIPGEEERDAAYYEAEDDDDDSFSSNNQGNSAREITAEDYYDDEDITEDELRALEGLGGKIFDD
jgi:hypothetical protein